MFAKKKDIDKIWKHFEYLKNKDEVEGLIKEYNTDTNFAWLESDWNITYGRKVMSGRGREKSCTIKEFRNMVNKLKAEKYDDRVKHEPQLTGDEIYFELKEKPKEGKEYKITDKPANDGIENCIIHNEDAKVRGPIEDKTDNWYKLRDESESISRTMAKGELPSDEQLQSLRSSLTVYTGETNG